MQWLELLPSDKVWCQMAVITMMLCAAFLSWFGSVSLDWNRAFEWVSSWLFTVVNRPKKWWKLQLISYQDVKVPRTYSKYILQNSSRRFIMLCISMLSFYRLEVTSACSTFNSVANMFSSICLFCMSCCLSPNTSTSFQLYSPNLCFGLKKFNDKMNWEAVWDLGYVHVTFRNHSEWRLSLLFYVFSFFFTNV